MPNTENYLFVYILGIYKRIILSNVCGEVAENFLAQPRR